MDGKKMIFAVAIAIFVRQESAASVETISDYAKVARNNGENGTAEQPEPPHRKGDNSMGMTSINNSSDRLIEYEDFDDAQEDGFPDRIRPKNEMMKFFGGLVSLMALMYQLNAGGKGDGEGEGRDERVKIPREAKAAEDVRRFRSETGNRFDGAQERFDFPQKKFKKGGDQKFPPVENYPPYDPPTGNGAETYGNDDRKTSYDVYDGKTALTDLTGSKTGKPDQQITYDPTGNGGTSWNVQNLRPVYRPWMSRPTTVERPTNSDPYQQSWLPEDDRKPPEGMETWNGQVLNENPIYQDDFEDSHHQFIDHNDHDHDHDHDHHHHDHEIVHPADEDRVSKKPYSYYFLGRKLWYIPLLFSVYFIIYIGALVLKSVARHKIQFPEKLWDLHNDVYGRGRQKSRKQRKIDEITEKYENAVEKIKNKFM